MLLVALDLDWSCVRWGGGESIPSGPQIDVVILGIWCVSPPCIILLLRDTSMYAGVDDETLSYQLIDELGRRN